MRSFLIIVICTLAAAIAIAVFYDLPGRLMTTDRVVHDIGVQTLSIGKNVVSIPAMITPETDTSTHSEELTDEVALSSGNHAPMVDIRLIPLMGLMLCLALRWVIYHRLALSSPAKRGVLEYCYSMVPFFRHSIAICCFIMILGPLIAYRSEILASLAYFFEFFLSISFLTFYSRPKDFVEWVFLSIYSGVTWILSFIITPMIFMFGYISEIKVAQFIWDGLKYFTPRVRVSRSRLEEFDGDYPSLVSFDAEYSNKIDNTFSNTKGLNKMEKTRQLFHILYKRVHLIDKTIRSISSFTAPLDDAVLSMKLDVLQYCDIPNLIYVIVHKFGQERLYKEIFKEENASPLLSVLNFLGYSAFTINQLDTPDKLDKSLFSHELNEFLYDSAKDYVLIHQSKFGNSSSYQAEVTKVLEDLGVMKNEISVEIAQTLGSLQNNGKRASFTDSKALLHSTKNLSSIKLHFGEKLKLNISLFRHLFIGDYLAESPPVFEVIPFLKNSTDLEVDIQFWPYFNSRSPTGIGYASKSAVTRYIEYYNMLKSMSVATKSSN